MGQVATPIRVPRTAAGRAVAYHARQRRLSRLDPSRALFRNATFSRGDTGIVIERRDRPVTFAFELNWVPNNYTAATISVDATGQTVDDTANGLGSFAVGEHIEIIGSTSNDQAFGEVTSAGAGSIGVNAVLSDESAGATITIRRHPQGTVFEFGSNLHGIGVTFGAGVPSPGILQMSVGNNVGIFANYWNITSRDSTVSLSEGERARYVVAVKNKNARIWKDGNVILRAAPDVSVGTVTDDFSDIAVGAVGEIDGEIFSGVEAEALNGAEMVGPLSVYYDQVPRGFD